MLSAAGQEEKSFVTLTCPHCGNDRNFQVKTLQMHVVHLEDGRVLRIIERQALAADAHRDTEARRGERQAAVDLGAAFDAAGHAGDQKGVGEGAAEEIGRAHV